MYDSTTFIYNVHMKNLSAFIQDEFIKMNLDKFFENSICIETIDQAEQAVLQINYGDYANIVFENSSIKNNFIDKLMRVRSDVNIINCNCTVNKFFENEFSGFLVFNNLKRCRHAEIIEEIKKHNAILLC